ncbi:MAG: UDP-3-O-(3-hydroxymyristoyl)glucosamine N-acyltransferase [Deltaproteobacteria bacterium]|nr:UDP-3-O-(3-hydroxymyristoyl)glucosamine N-acyltransferase [Deltaproteobacteria bacterium]
MKLPRPYNLRELAELAERKIKSRLIELGSPDLSCHVELAGDLETMVRAISPIESLEADCLTFAVKKSYLVQAEESDAAAIILPDSLVSQVKPYLHTPAPRLVFSVLLELTMEEPSLVPAVASQVRFKDRSSVELGKDVIIGDWCYIGEDVKIGQGCRIYPQVFIDDYVVLGKGCVIYPRVTLFRRTTLGKEVIVHSGAVIGDDGFGYNQMPDLKRGRLLHLKNEHAGGVLIEDNVEVGSQVCIDRGLADLTVVGSGTKIDNLTQIGHNVKIGRDCIIVNASIAGSAKIGHRAFLMGTNVRDGTKIGDDALVLAGATVLSDLPAGSARWAGSPAHDADHEWRITAIARKELPRLRQFFQLFKKAGSFNELKLEFFEPETRKDQK